MLKKSNSNYKSSYSKKIRLKLNPESNENEELNLDSSRTKEAMKLLGYSFDEISYVPFKVYVNLNQEIKNLPKELQRKRYNFSETFRQRKLEDIKYLKNQIDINKIPTISNFNFSKDYLLNEDNISSTAIIDNINYYNYSKIKNENDLISNIENKLENEICKIENENKIKRDNYKNKEYKKKKEYKKEIEKMEFQEKQFLKRKYEEMEELKRKKNNLVIYNKEYENYKSQKLVNEAKQKEKNEKNKEIEIHRNQYKEKVKKMNEEYNNKIREKALSLEQKHLNLKKELELIRRNQIENNKLKMEKKRQLVLSNMINLDNLLDNKIKNYEKKQKLEEEKQKRLKERKLEEKKEKLIELQLKKEIAQNVISKEKLLQEIKTQKLLNNIEKKKKKTEQILLTKSLDIQNKNEENNELNIVKQSNIKRAQNLKKLQRDNKLIYITNNQIKFNKFDKQKQYLSEQLINFNSSLSYRKEKYDNEIQKIFSNKTIDKKNINKLLEIFPNNEKIENLVKKLIQLENEREKDLKDYENNIKEIENVLKSRKKVFRNNIRFSNNHNTVFKTLNSNEFINYFDNNNENKNKKNIKKNTMSANNLRILPNKSKIQYLNNKEITPQLKININIENNDHKRLYSNCISGRNDDNLNKITNYESKKSLNEVIKPKKPFCLDKNSDLNTNQNTVNSFITNSYLPSNRSGNKIFYTNI